MQLEEARHWALWGRLGGRRRAAKQGSGKRFDLPNMIAAAQQVSEEPVEEFRARPSLAAKLRLQSGQIGPDDAPQALHLILVSRINGLDLIQREQCLSHCHLHLPRKLLNRASMRLLWR